MRRLQLRGGRLADAKKPSHGAFTNDPSDRPVQRNGRHRCPRRTQHGSPARRSADARAPRTGRCSGGHGGRRRCPRRRDARALRNGRCSGGREVRRRREGNSTRSEACDSQNGRCSGRSEERQQEAAQRGETSPRLLAPTAPKKPLETAPQSSGSRQEVQQAQTLARWRPRQHGGRSGREPCQRRRRARKTLASNARTVEGQAADPPRPTPRSRGQCRPSRRWQPRHPCPSDRGPGRTRGTPTKQ
jgi:hypothetical protein